MRCLKITSVLIAIALCVPCSSVCGEDNISLIQSPSFIYYCDFLSPKFSFNIKPDLNLGLVACA